MRRRRRKSRAAPPSAETVAAPAGARRAGEGCASVWRHLEDRAAGDVHGPSIRGDRTSRRVVVGRRDPADRPAAIVVRHATG